MKCPTCGKTIKESDQYCPFCGSPTGAGGASDEAEAHEPATGETSSNQADTSNSAESEPADSSKPSDTPVDQPSYYKPMDASGAFLPGAGFNGLSSPEPKPDPKSKIDYDTYPEGFTGPGASSYVNNSDDETAADNASESSDSDTISDTAAHAFFYTEEDEDKRKWV